MTRIAAGHYVVRTDMDVPFGLIRQEYAQGSGSDLALSRSFGLGPDPELVRPLTGRRSGDLRRTGQLSPQDVSTFSLRTAGRFGFTKRRQRAPPPPTQRRHGVQICGSLTWTGPYPGALLGERWPSMSVCQILRKPGDISLLSGPVRIGHWRQTDSRIEGTTTLGVPPPSSEHLNQGAQPAGTPTNTTRPARSLA